MKLELHHINVCSSNVPQVNEFYRKVLNLKGVEDDDHVQDTTKGYDNGVEFVTDGQVEFHLATTDLGVSYRTGQPVNPLERGHIAFRTDDIEAFKKHLTDNGVAFADYGVWAMAGWYQIFFQDPAGTIIEVHQVNYK